MCLARQQYCLRKLVGVGLRCRIETTQVIEKTISMMIWFCGFDRFTAQKAAQGQKPYFGFGGSSGGG